MFFFTIGQKRVNYIFSHYTVYTTTSLVTQFQPSYALGSCTRCALMISSGVDSAASKLLRVEIWSGNWNYVNRKHFHSICFQGWHIIEQEFADHFSYLQILTTYNNIGCRRWLPVVTCFQFHLVSTIVYPVILEKNEFIMQFVVRFSHIVL